MKIKEKNYQKGRDGEDIAKEFLINKGYDPRFGARPMRRTIQTFVEDELSERFLKGDFMEGCTISADYSAGKVVMRTDG